MSPIVKSLLLLAKRLAPIPGFLAAFAAWGFVFSRYSDPPVDMAGRVLAANIAAAASASAAKAGLAGPGKGPGDEDWVPKHAFTPYDACVQQQALFPSVFGAIECNEDDLAPVFAWAWKMGGKSGDKAGSPRPRSSASEGPPVRRPGGGEPGDTPEAPDPEP